MLASTLNATYLEIYMAQAKGTSYRYRGRGLLANGRETLVSGGPHRYGDVD